MIDFNWHESYREAKRLISTLDITNMALAYQICKGTSNPACRIFYRLITNVTFNTRHCLTEEIFLNFCERLINSLETDKLIPEFEGEFGIFVFIDFLDFIKDSEVRPIVINNRLLYGSALLSVLRNAYPKLIIETKLPF